MEINTEKTKTIFEYYSAQNSFEQRMVDMKLEILELTQQSAYWKFQHKQSKEKTCKSCRVAMLRIHRSG